LLIVTLPRVPTPFADTQFYASIARARQLVGVGIPSWMQHSPAAVDHIPFYGPVYFTLAAQTFDWFGVSLRGYRAVSLLGTLLVVAATALLVRSISPTSGRWLWAVTLLLLTPDIRTHATEGTMHALAVGFEAMALATFVGGLATGRGRAWFGAAAGAFLTLAALTTPRTYPFIAGFFVAGLLLPCMPSDARRLGRRQLAVAAATFAVGIGAWTIASHGNPLRWIRYMTFIAMHENTDVALLPGATRVWLFSWANALTSLIAAAAATIVVAKLSRGRRTDERAGLAAFALVTCGITMVVSAVVMNLTLDLGIYVGLPLFITVLAMPYEAFGVSRRALGLAVAFILSIETAFAGIWYLRVAATWDARDPEPLYAFFRTHVPEGSAVVGPPAPFFFAVERAGSRYRVAEAESWADWARWVPVIEPDAVAAARNVPIAPTGNRYFVWFTGDEVPAEYACAAPYRIATFEPAPHHLSLLGWLGRRTLDVGYPGASLYRLPQGCPTGYDPTHS
jgi:hypothetical protein